MECIYRVKNFILSNRRHASSVAFALGFVWDSLTLTRVDMLYDNIVLTVYITVATVGIIFFHAVSSGKLIAWPVERIAPWLPLIIQFAFGGLFSGYIIYYSQSGTLIGSWPFILFLLTLFIGNEVLKKRYQTLVFQFAILFIALFSYSIFFIPVLVRSIGTLVFLSSGLVSLVLTAGVVAAVHKLAPSRIEEAKKPLLLSIIGLYVFFNLAYFLNIIPPIPLALKDLGIYHHVEKISSGYAVSYERPLWYRFFDETSRTFHMSPGESVYALSAVFAPTRLNTIILHRWSYYDEASNGWVVASEIPFPISGGRDGGYRGYSFKRKIFEGKWRLEVITQRGQLLGRRTFSIETGGLMTDLHTAIK